MDILLIGKGGREHAIAWALKKSPKVNKIYCLPGNGGIEEIAECEKIGVMDFNRILKFLQEHPDIGLTVVAPDDPLAEGLVDILEENGYRAFGPNKAAAHIEASKSFAKNLMKKYNIPTPKFEVFDDYHEAIEYVRNQTYPIDRKSVV